MVNINIILTSTLVTIVALTGIFFLFYKFYFLRNPKRVVPLGNVLVSPANGKVVRIVKLGCRNEEIVDKGLFGKVHLLVKDVVKDGYLIVIMMTPFNVHYQRSPIEGIVEKTTYSKGLFVNAVKDASSLVTLENEKNEIIIKNKKIGRIKVVQVAGFLARRIKCFVRPDEKVDKCQDIGLICLGSQVLLVIPKLKLAVKENDIVIDGETVIARF